VRAPRNVFRRVLHEMAYATDRLTPLSLVPPLDALARCACRNGAPILLRLAAEVYNNLSSFRSQHDISRAHSHLLSSVQSACATSITATDHAFLVNFSMKIRRPHNHKRHGSISLRGGRCTPSGSATVV